MLGMFESLKLGLAIIEIGSTEDLLPIPTDISAALGSCQAMFSLVQLASEAAPTEVAVFAVKLQASFLTSFDPQTGFISSLFHGRH